nr:MAG TPA: hypothetical protein [Caudoviricetes sp.]
MNVKCCFLKLFSFLIFSLLSVAFFSQSEPSIKSLLF